MIGNRKLLIIGKVWPEPKSSAAGIRMMQLISFFLKEGMEITFASTAKKTSFEQDLGGLGVKQVSIALNDSSFDCFLTELNPEVVVFDRFMTEEQFGWRVMEVCPGALRVLNTEDLHFLRRARQLSIKKGEQLCDVNLHTDDSIREVSSIYRCDLTLLVSRVELELLKSKFDVPEELLHYLPVFSEPLEEVPPFDQRDGFMYIGNFYHEPNWDALKHLKKDIWPLLRRKLPNAVLHVYGAYPGQKVLDFHNEKEGFIVHGRAADALQVTLNKRVSVVPLRFGAGIKGKLLEAMRTGTPSVTTSIGVEGMSGKDDWSGIVADDLDGFVSAAVKLYTDQLLWEKAQRRGFEILNDNFNDQYFLPLFSDKIVVLLRGLNDHRDSFFVQKLIQHQSLMSNRYLSKWIEEKNK